MSRKLSFTDCIQSPCHGCSAPCCSFLPLHDFVIASYTDADYARYLLNFANIELALVQGQTWRVHLKSPCTRLQPNGLCGLHDSPKKPQVCLNYDARKCFYKPMFLETETEQFLRFDAVRFQALLRLMEFDGSGVLSKLPAVETMIQELPPFIDHPYEPIAQPKPTWSADTIHSFSSMQSQCEGCAAWCCQTLSFPFGGIHSVNNLDYVWFCLGFPNVELAVTEQGMSIFVHSRCRNLESVNTGGCSVFGTDSRPLVCEQYDRMSCAYKVQVGTVNPKTSLRIGLRDFEAFQTHFQFDVAGQCTGRSDFIQIRDSVREKRVSEPL